MVICRSSNRKLIWTLKLECFLNFFPNTASSSLWGHLAKDSYGLLQYLLFLFLPLLTGEHKEVWKRIDRARGSRVDGGSGLSTDSLTHEMRSESTSRGGTWGQEREACRKTLWSSSTRDSFFAGFSLNFLVYFRGKHRQPEDLPRAAHSGATLHGGVHTRSLHAGLSTRSDTLGGLTRHLIQADCAALCLVARLCLALCDPMDCIPARLLCPWGSSRQEYWSGLPCLLQGIFPTQGSNPGLPHCRQILYCLSHQEVPQTVYQLLT